MKNADLERLYQINAGASNADGLRGVFNAGFAAGAGLTTAPSAGDPSAGVAINTALKIVPIIKTKTKDD
jgi:hypothetical protein